MDSFKKEAILQKIQELQALLMGGEDVGMESEQHEASELPKEEEVEEKSEKELQEEERAPIVKDKGIVGEQIEEAKGRGPISFKEKAKAFKR